MISQQPPFQGEKVLIGKAEKNKCVESGPSS
jgi:hypothetical protein